MSQTRRQTVLGAAALGAAGCGTSPHPPPGAAPAITQGRVLVGVHLNGSGPYTFALDTAANASVIASDLAEVLELPRGPAIGMHTLIAREEVGTVRLARVRAGAMNVRNVNLAIGSRVGLAGVDGLLGTDLLRNLRVEIRFGGATRARISPSQRTGGPTHYQTNVRVLRTLEQRPDGLMKVQAQAGAAELQAIVDTGALVSVANSALAAAAPLFPLDLETTDGREQVVSPTGLSRRAPAMYLPRLELGGVLASELTVLTGDFHTFNVWGVADRPALLLGVDILRLFRSVAIDLLRGELILEV